MREVKRIFPLICESVWSYIGFYTESAGRVYGRIEASMVNCDGNQVIKKEKRKLRKLKLSLKYICPDSMLIDRNTTKSLF